MNVKEAARLLNWPRDQVILAIKSGVALGTSKIHLEGSPMGNDYDISDDELDQFINQCEANEPGRHPPLSVRRSLLVEANHRCGICREPAPLQFHHILEWERIKHHDCRHMIAVCGTCHDKIRLGEIDHESQINYKDLLGAGPKIPDTADGTQEDGTVTGVDIDQADSQRIAVLLPRGVIVLDDVEYSDRVGWSITLHYYHLGEEGWRGGTHYHRSYERRWRDPEHWTIQYQKMDIPSGDWRFAYVALRMAQDIADFSAPFDVRKFTESYPTDQPILYLAEGQALSSNELPSHDFGLRGTDRLRDIIADLAYFAKSHHMDREVLHSNSNHLRHRAALIAGEDIPRDSPSHRFIGEVIDSYHKDMSPKECRSWLSDLADVLTTSVRFLPPKIE